MKREGSQKTEMELRSLLGGFLFGGDDVEKKIKVLSGGEKARVALAKTIVSKANFLLLDEPTNHLDMHSVELLANALNKYQGSYILVSHDRYFISKTANKIWEIADYKIKEFKGTYDEWVQWNERMARLEAEKKNENGKLKTENIKKEEVKPVQPVQEKPVNNSPVNRELQRELQKQQRRLIQLEEDISKASSEREKLEQALAAPENYADKKKFVAVENDYKKAEQKLQTLNKEYESLFEKVMELETQVVG
jgi:ATP-binding cassette subfamily F protein 3